MKKIFLLVAGLMVLIYGVAYPWPWGGGGGGVFGTGSVTTTEILDGTISTGDLNSGISVRTTGTITGAVNVNTDANGMTESEMTTAGVYGTLFLATGSGTWTLPTAVLGMSLCLMDSGTAHDLILDVQSTDNVILVGVVGAGGVGVTNASGSSLGDFICATSAAANKWYVTGAQGTWASQ